MHLGPPRHDDRCDNIHKKPWNDAGENDKEDGEQSQYGRVNVKVLSYAPEKAGYHLIARAAVELFHRSIVAYVPKFLQ